MKLIGLLVVLFPAVLIAQINESDTVRFKANLSLTGAWQEGNAEVLIFRGKAEVVVSPTRAIVFKTQNAYLYQEFFKRKADEDIYSRNLLYYRPDRRFYPFLLGYLTTNFRRKVDLRYLAGGGMTWQMVRKKNHLLKLGLSGEYEESRFTQNSFSDVSYNGNNAIITWRATSWLYGRHQIGKQFVLHYEAYYQPSVEIQNNYRWQADIGLEIPLRKFLNFRVNYLHTYESIVVAGTKQEDRILTFGVRLILR